MSGARARKPNVRRAKPSGQDPREAAAPRRHSDAKRSLRTSTVRIHARMYIDLYIYIYIYVYIGIFTNIHVYICRYIYIYISISMSISFFIFINQSVSMYVYMYIYLSLSIYPSIYLSIPAVGIQGRRQLGGGTPSQRETQGPLRCVYMQECISIYIYIYM